MAAGVNKNLWHKTMYDSLFAEQTIGSKKWNDRSNKEIKFLIETLKAPKGSTWLDVPCGTGRHAGRLAKAGYDVTGIDISRDCLALAKKQYRHANLRFLYGDMSDLGLFYGKFDVVSNMFSSFGYFATDQENKKKGPERHGQMFEAWWKARH